MLTFYYMEIFPDDDKAVREFSKILSFDLNEQNKEKLMKDILFKMSGIPYENITKHIRKKLISPSDILFDFKNYGTGSTCFPLVYLLKRIFDFAGIRSYVLLADRTYAPNSHTLLLVEMGKRFYIADIGFLVFVPVDITSGKTEVDLPQGRLSFSVSGNYLETYTVFPNGHRKFRYKAHLKPVSKEDFISAWEETYEFEMMNHVVVSKLLKDKIIYIRDNFVHFIKGGVSKNFKMEKEEVLKIIREIGIDENIFLRVWQDLLNPNQ